MAKAKLTQREAVAGLWDALSPWSKRATVITPVLVLLGLLSPYASSMIGVPPFAHRSVELGLAQLQSRFDLQEKLQWQKQIFDIKERAARERRSLTPGEQDFIRELERRIAELERRK